VSSLTAWSNFYVIVGSSGGALTGLTFVVITLIAGRARPVGLAAFTTPTIVHFGAVLLAAALLSAPWQALAPIALLLGLGGAAGAGYAVMVIRRPYRVEGYALVREDWLWYGLFPLVAYAALVVVALLLPGDPTPALFGVGAVLLVFLVLGIRNSWDVVTYIALEVLPAARDAGRDGARDARRDDGHA
jgi:hypothetical protein